MAERSDRDEEMARNEESTSEKPDSAPRASLVPLYSPLDVTRGIQAYRRGDMILYTVRGEPGKVQELIGELDRRGVEELVALVSHRALSGAHEDAETVVDAEEAASEEEAEES
jgi:hypothetical protein